MKHGFLSVCGVVPGCFAIVMEAFPLNFHEISRTTLVSQQILGRSLGRAGKVLQHDYF